MYCCIKEKKIHGSEIDYQLLAILNIIITLNNSPNREKHIIDNSYKRITKNPQIRLSQSGKTFR